MTRDSLSDVLELIGAHTSFVGGLAAGGAWALRFPPPHKIKLLAIARGQAWLRIEGEQTPVLLSAGDAFLLTVARSFVLASALDQPPLAASDVFSGDPGEIRHVGHGEDFLSLGSHVWFEAAHAELLIESLPRYFHVRAGSPQAQTLSWLIDKLVAEARANQPGASFASSQLTQLLFLEVMRTYVASSDASVSGRLKVIADRRLSAALEKMHAEPARAWQVDELARIAGMSRTAFAVHFKAVAGVAPLAYLTEWRMRLAQQKLARTDASIAELAPALGYASESAFSTAFKRVTGISPMFYRARARGD